MEGGFVVIDNDESDQEILVIPTRRGRKPLKRGADGKILIWSDENLYPDITPTQQTEKQLKLF